MGLRTDAVLDMAEIHADTDDFGWEFQLTDPNGLSADFVGLTNDIAQTIDPETGILVSGRTASVSIPVAQLVSAGMGYPVGISDDLQRPWVAVFLDSAGTSWTYKITSGNPDRKFNVINCELEQYGS